MPWLFVGLSDLKGNRPRDTYSNVWMESQTSLLHDLKRRPLIVMVEMMMTLSRQSMMSHLDLISILGESSTDTNRSRWDSSEGTDSQKLVSWLSTCFAATDHIRSETRIPVALYFLAIHAAHLLVSFHQLL